MSRKRAAVRIRAEWDPEARVWVAESANLPGLVTEAETVELLFEKLRVMVPELLSYSPDLASAFLPTTTKPCARDLIGGNPKIDHPVVGSDPILDST